MAFRRSRETKDERRRFADFARANAALLTRLGVPAFVCESWREWNYFLMHGAASPDAPFAFATEDFNPVQHAPYAGLLSRSLKAGFDNPGILGWNGSVNGFNL